MIRTAVFGIGGFGRVHVNALRQMEKEGLAQLVAAAQPSLPGMEDQIAALRDSGVPVYADWQELLDRERPEAVTIATPVHLHEEMTAGALDAGAQILLEKPPLPSVTQLDALVAQAATAGKLCGVDFQMLSGESTRDLKALVASGELGTVRRVAGGGLWKRQDVYYESSPWHGRLRHGDHWSLAGPVANALGHVLNQCLYFATPEAGFAWPERVEAEMYRAHPNIENEDVASVRVHTDAGAEVLFYVTFCAEQQSEPWIDLETDLANVRWEYDHALIIRWRNGREERREYGPEGRIEHTKMFRNFFRTLRGEESLICPLAAARAFTSAVTQAYEAGSPVQPVEPAHIRRIPEGNSVSTIIPGVEGAIARAAAEGALLSEIGAPFAG